MGWIWQLMACCLLVPIVTAQGTGCSYTFSNDTTVPLAEGDSVVDSTEVCVCREGNIACSTPGCSHTLTNGSTIDLTPGDVTTDGMLRCTCRQDSTVVCSCLYTLSNDTEVQIAVGESVMDQTESCICPDDGVVTCSTPGCSHTLKNGSTIDLSPGDEVSDERLRCTCRQDSTVVCSCLYTLSNDTEVQIAVGESVMDQTESCICRDDGNVTCSSPGCSWTLSNDTTVALEEGDSFLDDLLTCTCRRGIVECDPMGCEIDDGDGGVTYLSEGESFSKEGRNCTCVQSKMTCSDKPGCEDGKYSDGESFNVDCNQCTCIEGVIACTKKACDTCDLRLLRKSIVGIFDVAVTAIGSADRHRGCSSRIDIEAFAEWHLHVCREDFGPVMTDVLWKYFAVLRIVSSSACKTHPDGGRPFPGCDLSTAGNCLLEFAQVAVGGSRDKTCRQTKWSSTCIEKATAKCPASVKTLVSMVTNTMDVTMTTVCRPDTCSISKAERCMDEARGILKEPLYRDGMMPLTCGRYKKALSCAARHIVSCTDLKEDGWEDIDWSDLISDSKSGSQSSDKAASWPRSEGSSGSQGSYKTRPSETKGTGTDSRGSREGSAWRSADRSSRRESSVSMATSRETGRRSKGGSGSVETRSSYLGFVSRLKEELSSLTRGRNSDGGEKSGEYSRENYSPGRDGVSGSAEGSSDVLFKSLDDFLEKASERIGDLQGVLDGGGSSEEDKEYPLEVLRQRLLTLRDTERSGMSARSMESLGDRLQDIQKELEDAEVELQKDMDGMIEKNIAELREMVMEDEEYYRSALVNRLHKASNDLTVLYGKGMEMCAPERDSCGVDDISDEGSLGQGLLNIVGSLMKTPFADKDNLCMLLQSVESSFNGMEEDGTEKSMSGEAVQSMWLSVKHGHSLLECDKGSSKGETTDEEKDCTPAEQQREEPPEPVCNIEAAIMCDGIENVMRKFNTFISMPYHAYEEACEYAMQSLRCIETNLAACPNPELQEIWKAKDAIIEFFGPATFGCDFSPAPEPEKPVCETEQVCDPKSAVEACFTKEFTDACEYATTTLVPCFKPYTACRFSQQLWPLQERLDVFLDSNMENSSACPALSRSILPMDATFASAVCRIDLSRGVKMSVRQAVTFTDALCEPLESFAECIDHRQPPYLISLLKRDTKAVFKEYISDYCMVHVIDAQNRTATNSTTQEEQAMPPLPDFQDCDNVDLAVQCVLQHLMELDEVVGFESGTERYTKTCGEEALQGVESCISDATCPDSPSFDYFMDGMELLRRVRSVKCHLSGPIPQPGTCDLDGVKSCMWKFGAYLGSASPHDLFQEKLDEFLDCVDGFSVSCGENETAMTMEQLDGISRFLGAAMPTKPPRWCQVAGERGKTNGTSTGTDSRVEVETEAIMQGEEEEDGQAEEEQTVVETASTSTNVTLNTEEKPFCAEPLSCSLSWEKCLPENRSEICSRRDEVVSCIEDITSGCSRYQRIAIQAMVTRFQIENGVMECNLLSDSSDGSLRWCTVSAPILSHEDLCQELKAYTMCLRDNSENSSSWMMSGMVEKVLQNYQSYIEERCTKYVTDDGCPRIEEGTVGTCIHECSESSDCANETICCSNGCGMTCQEPFVEVPVTEDRCPRIEEGTVGTCIHECSESSECANGTICCSNGCGMTCQEPFVEGPPPPELEEMSFNVNKLLNMVLDFPWHPMTDRFSLCDRGETLFMDVMEGVDGCNHTACKELATLTGEIGGLVDSFEICVADPSPRECDVKAATACTSDLGLSVMRHIHQGTEYAICSKVIPTEKCISQKIGSCKSKERTWVEDAYMCTGAVVEKICAPAVAPDHPMATCVAPDKPAKCQFDKALSTLLPLHREVMEKRPDWKAICPKLPLLRTVMDSYVSGCPECDLESFGSMKSKLLAKIGDRCPELNCDICGSNRCLARLQNVDSSDYCSSVERVKDCVSKTTKACEKKHVQDVYERLERIEKTSKEFCKKKLQSCIHSFTDIAFQINIYKGPLLTIEVEPEKSDKGEESDETKSGSPKNPSGPRSGETGSRSRSETRSGNAERPSGPSSAKTGSRSTSETHSGTAERPSGPSSAETGSRSRSETRSGTAERPSGPSSARTVSRSRSETRYGTAERPSGPSSARTDSQSRSETRSGTAERPSRSGSSGTRSRSEGSKSGITITIDTGIDYDCVEYDGEPWWNEIVVEYDGDSEEYRSKEGSASKERSGGSGTEISGISVGTVEVDADSGEAEEEETLSPLTRRKRSASKASGSRGSAESAGPSAGTKSPKSGSKSKTSEESKIRTKDITKSKSERSGSPERSTTSGSRRCPKKRPAPMHPKLFKLCSDLYKSKDCVKAQIVSIDKGIGEVVMTTLDGMLKVAAQKCRVPPLKCHSCHKASSHEECDKQPYEECGRFTQSCQTIEVSGKRGYITKGCAKPDKCENGCNGGGTRCESCCSTPFCNKGIAAIPIPDEPSCETGTPLSNTTTGEAIFCGRGGESCPTASTCRVHPTDKWAVCCEDSAVAKPVCHPASPTLCGINLVSTLLDSDRMECKALAASVLCLKKASESCHTESFDLVDVYIKKLMASDAWQRCHEEEKGCDCGLFASLSLTYAIANPYIVNDNVTICRHLHHANEMAQKAKASEYCSDDEVKTVSGILRLAHTNLEGICADEPEPEPKLEELCPLLEANSPCASDCSEDANCTRGVCCEYECGGVCEELVKVDPEARDGLCPPKFYSDICYPEYPNAQCRFDSECENGSKCCEDPCGGNFCAIIYLPPDKTPKDGQCPEYSPSDGDDDEGRDVRDVRYQPCMYDSECFERQKCCTQSSGSDTYGFCTEPVMPVECAEGVPIPMCVRAPCDAVKCPAHPEAVCFENYCGGCNAQYYLKGVDVTSSCSVPGNKTQCELPALNADCPDDQKTKWYFDSTTGVCEEGCSDNGQYFGSEQECVGTCTPRCMEPFSEGYCTDDQLAWYFDKEVGCTEFKYTGCGGSRNRFSTKVECLMECKRVALEDECRDVNDTVQSIMETAKTDLVIADKSIVCSTLKKLIQSHVDRCALPKIVEIITTSINGFFDDNCEETEAGPTEDTVEEGEMEGNKTCQSISKIQEACFPGSEMEATCASVQNAGACIKAMTEGCNFNAVQLEPVIEQLSTIKQALNNPDNCSAEGPSYADTSLMQFVVCRRAFLTNFAIGLESHFFPRGDPAVLCSAIGDMKSCILRYDGMSARSRLRGLLKMTSKLQDTFCLDLDMDVGGDDNLQCYTCDDEEDNANCTETIQTCRSDQKVCSTTTYIDDDGTKRIAKGCSSEGYPATNPCIINRFEQKCFHTCTSNLCNKDLVISDQTDTADPETDADVVDEVVEEQADDTCDYVSIGSVAQQKLEALTTIGFLSRDERNQFCGDESSLAEVENRTANCGNESTTRIQKVMELLGAISSHMCPVPRPLPTCESWRECIQGFQHVMKSLHDESVCPLLKRSVDCLEGALGSCSYAERKRIGQEHLPVIRSVLSGSTCDLNLGETICTALDNKDEPLCKDTAPLCTALDALEGTPAPEELCVAAVTTRDCIMYYRSGCELDEPANAAIESVNNIFETNFGCSDTESEFSPPPCIPDLNPSQCSVFLAVQLTQNIIEVADSGQYDAHDICEEAESMIILANNAVTDCNALQFTVAEESAVLSFNILNWCFPPNDQYRLGPLMPLAACVSGFIKSVNDIMLHPISGYGNLCSTVQTTIECIEEIDGNDSFFGSAIIHDHLELLKQWHESCNDTELPATDEGTLPDQCSPARAAHCVLSDGTMHLFGPVLNLDDKKQICDLDLALEMDGCRRHIAECPPLPDGLSFDTLLQRISSIFNFVSSRSKMCENASDLEDDGMPAVLACDHDRALSCISELGMSLSECIHSDSLRGKVCSSVDYIDMCVESNMRECPDQMQEQVHYTWTQMQSLVERVCSDEPEPVPLPDIPTPDCVVKGRRIPEGSCSVDVAKMCSMALENEMSSDFSSKERLAIVAKRAVSCFQMYGENCPPSLATYIGRDIWSLVDVVADRVEIWCPVAPPPVCYIHGAKMCLTKFENAIDNEDEDPCSMVEETKSCITSTTVDCKSKDRLAVVNKMKRLVRKSSSRCEKDSSDETKGIEECMEHFRDKAETLLRFVDADRTKSTESDQKSTGSDPDTDENQSQGSDVANGEGEEEASAEVEEVEGSDESQPANSAAVEGPDESQPSARQNDTSSAANGQNEDEESSESPASDRQNSTASGSGGSGDEKEDKSLPYLDFWVNAESREFEDTIALMCQDTFDAWRCVEDGLGRLPPRRRSIPEKSLKCLWQSIIQICKPMHCHSCSGLEDNDECNEQPTCECPTSKQVCISKYDGGKYYKGCAGQKDIDNCNAMDEDCYHCSGDTCNHPGRLGKESECAVGKAASCFFSLVVKTLQTDEISYRSAEADLACITTASEGCTSHVYKCMHSTALDIIELLKTGQCVALFGNPHCATDAILALGYLSNSPFMTAESICGQYHATGLVKFDAENAGICPESDMVALNQSYALATTQLGSLCVDDANSAVCNIAKAKLECITSYVLPDNCSHAVPVFIGCLTPWIKGCTSLQTPSLKLDVQRHIAEVITDCVENVEEQIMSALFPEDEYSPITMAITNFTEQLTSSMAASINFLEDICLYLEELRSDASDLQASPLAKALGFEGIEIMWDTLEDTCKDTSITNDQVEEECSGKKIDLLVIFDGSTSIGDSNFELMKTFVKSLIERDSTIIADDGLQIALIQFSDTVKVEFYFNSFSTKEEVLDAIDNIAYKKGRTNPAEALRVARTDVFTEAKGAREGVLKQIIFLADGEHSSSHFAPPEAEGIRVMQAGINVFSVGVNMDTEDGYKELLSMAFKQSPENVYQIDDFDKLQNLSNQISVVVCRNADVSYCDYDELVKKSSSSVVSSLTSNYVSLDDKGSFCKTIEQSSESVDTLSVNCSKYQRNVLDLVQTITKKLSTQTCVNVIVVEEPDPSDPSDPTCDTTSALANIEDMAQYLRCGGHDDDSSICKRVKVLLHGLNFRLRQCNDDATKNEVVVALSDVKHLLLNRCPDLTAELLCWGEDSTEVVATAMDEDQLMHACKPDKLFSQCLTNFDFQGSVVDIFDLEESCRKFNESLMDSMDCVRTEFMDMHCDRLWFPRVQEYHFPDMDILQVLCGISAPSSYLQLPDDYGVPVARPCETPLVCDTQAAATCLLSYEQSATSECGNWPEVHECIAIHTVDCHDADIFDILNTVSLSVGSDLSPQCLEQTMALVGGDQEFTNCVTTLFADVNSAIMRDDGSVCSAYLVATECLSTSMNNSPFLRGLYYSMERIQIGLTAFCDSLEQEETTGGQDENDDKKCNLAEALDCLRSFVIPAAFAPALSLPGKRNVCKKTGGNLECLDEFISSCPTVIANKIWLAHHLAEAIVLEGGFCDPEPILCSTIGASACIFNLSETMTMHGLSAKDNDKVCSAIPDSRGCLERNLLGCDTAVKQSMVVTYKNVECLALDKCPAAVAPEEYDPDDEPADCIDPAEVDDQAKCSPYSAIKCVKDFEKTASAVFRRNTKITCLEYAEMLRCVSRNLYQCLPKQMGLAPIIVGGVMATTGAACPTILKHPCIEVDECEAGLKKAETCLGTFADKIASKDATEICPSLEITKTCLTANLRLCSNATIASVWEAYEGLLGEVSVSCEDDVHTCTNKFIFNAKSILLWNINGHVEVQAEPVCVEESESENSQETEETSSGTGSRSTTKSKSTGRTGSATDDTGSATGGRSAASGTRSRGSATSKKTKSTKTSKEHSGSQISNPSEPKSEKCEDIVIDWVARGTTLHTFCVHFAAAFTCLTDHLGVLDPAPGNLVLTVFNAYSAFFAGICAGPKIGTCPINEAGCSGQMVAKPICTNDFECPGHLRCCELACNKVCLEPELDDSKCLESFSVSVIASFELLLKLYPGQVNGTMQFCSIYTETIAQLSRTLELCQDRRQQWVVEDVLAVCSQTHYELCTIAPPVSQCKEDDAMNCIIEYQQKENDETIDDFQLCSEYEATRQCVSDQLKYCSEKVDEEKAIIDSINGILAEKREALNCFSIPDPVIDPSNDVLWVNEGDIPGKTVEISFEDAPQCPPGSTCSVRIEYEVTQDESKWPTCPDKRPIKQLFVGNFCDMTFTDFSVTKSFTITGRLDHKKDGDYEAELTLTAILFVANQEVLRKTIVNFRVVVVDRDTGALCKIVNDPHMTSFDGIKYDNMAVGEFVHYQHTSLPYEVRGWQTDCTAGKRSASCSCGAAIRCGDSVLAINYCTKNKDKRGRNIYSNDGGVYGCRMYTAKKGRHTKVIMPTGTEVTVKAKKSKKSGRRFVAIFIKPGCADFGQTTGLCGVYDNDKSNDLITPDGTIYSYEDLLPKDPKKRKYALRPRKVTKLWKTSKEQDYYFEGTPANVDLVDMDKFCLCEGANPTDTCDISESCAYDAVEVTDQWLAKEKKKKEKGKGRRKRATGNVLEDIDIDVNAEEEEPGEFPTPSGITEVAADEHCDNALKTAGFYDKCQDVSTEEVMEGCRMDILITDELANEFMPATIDSFMEKCVTVKLASTNATSVQEILSVTCEDDCSGNGVCDNGTCICNAPFAGPGCDDNLNDPPTLDNLDENLCTPDSDAACTSIVIAGDGFVDLDTLTCHVETLEITEAGLGASLGVEAFPATFESFDEVECQLPAWLPKRAMKISVSNNGEETARSTPQLLVAHDPVCWTCLADNTTGTCTRELASCLIDNVCYGPNAENPNDSCYICNTITGNWTYTPRLSDACPGATTTTVSSVEKTKLTDDDSDDMTVIGLSAGIAGVVLIVIVVAVAVFAVRKHHMSNKLSEDERKVVARRPYSREGFNNQGYYYPHFIEAPQDVFNGSNGLPTRTNSRHSRGNRHDEYYNGDYFSA